MTNDNIVDLLAFKNGKLLPFEQARIDPLYDVLRQCMSLVSRGMVGLKLIENYERAFHDIDQEMGPKFSEEIVGKGSVDLRFYSTILGNTLFGFNQGTIKPTTIESYKKVLDIVETCDDNFYKRAKRNHQLGDLIVGSENAGEEEVEKLKLETVEQILVNVFNTASDTEIGPDVAGLIQDFHYRRAEKAAEVKNWDLFDKYSKRFVDFTSYFADILEETEGEAQNCMAELKKLYLEERKTQDLGIRTDIEYSNTSP